MGTDEVAHLLTKLILGSPPQYSSVAEQRNNKNVLGLIFHYRWHYQLNEQLMWSLPANAFLLSTTHFIYP